MMHSLSDSLELFAGVAREFCSWAESKPSDEASEARIARRLLLELTIHAINLPLSDPADTSLDLAVADDAYDAICRRFGSLPFNYYSKCFNPLVVPAEEPVVADLADDLSDIWRDLKPGLALWHTGLSSGATGIGAFILKCIGGIMLPPRCTLFKLACAE